MVEHSAIAQVILDRPKYQTNNWIPGSSPQLDSKSELVKFNISGTEFLLSLDLLKKYPEGVLASKDILDSHWREELNAFFFDRDPTLFNTILNLYRYDFISTPANYSEALVLSEIQYWKLPLLNMLADDEIEKDFLWMEDRIPPPNQPSSRLKNFRFQLWCVLTDPLGPHTKYQWLSLAHSISTLVMLLSFLILLGLSTSEQFRELEYSNALDNGTLAADFKWSTACKTRLDCLVITKPKSSIALGLKIGAVAFSVETVAKILACPNYSIYFRSVMNWLDLFATLCVVLFSIGTVARNVPRLIFLILGNIQLLRLIKIFQVSPKLIVHIAHHIDSRCTDGL